MGAVGCSGVTLGSITTQVKESSYPVLKGKFFLHLTLHFKAWMKKSDETPPLSGSHECSTPTGKWGIKLERAPGRK